MRIRRVTRLTTRFIDPGDFDITDAKEAVGEIAFDDIDASEPNDCDHRAQVAACGEVRCANCGRRMG
jgi:hypothetical protein